MWILNIKLRFVLFWLVNSSLTVVKQNLFVIKTHCYLFGGQLFYFFLLTDTVKKNVMYTSMIVGKTTYVFKQIFYHVYRPNRLECLDIQRSQSISSTWKINIQNLVFPTIVA